MSQPMPSNENHYLVEHIALLRKSYQHYTGRQLIDPGLDPEEAAKQLFQAPFCLLSHDAQSDPIFTYANQAAMDLFEMPWETLLQTPSRLSAEAPNREERAQLLEQVTKYGFIDNYAGIRISSTGRRFRIHQATVWNLIDENDQYCGQAATFSEWTDL